MSLHANAAPGAASPVSKLKSRAGGVGVVIWGAGTLFSITVLMVNHFVAMPSPSDYDLLVGGVRVMQREERVPLLLHVIYANCSCTNGLFRHLLARRALPGFQERILFVGIDAERRRGAEAQGFEFEEIDRAELAKRFGIEAAPLFMVYDHQELGYVGGYYETPATVHPRDQEILPRVLAGETVEPLPLYGCAVSPDLQRALDPLGIKYPSGG